MSKKENIFLKKCVRNIARQIKPKRIILFGSYAYGQPTRDSDLDLLVVKETRLPFAERIRRVYSAIGKHEFPLDVLVLTPNEIKRRLMSFDPFLDEAMTRGQVLYEQL